MAIKSDNEIYQIIERHVKASAEPLTCVALFDHDDVKQYAKTPDKVSDFLGLMWRRGILQRWNVPKTSTDRSRFAYTWLTEADDNLPKKVTAITGVAANYGKENITITEDGNRIIIDFPKFTLTVQSKTGGR